MESFTTPLRLFQSLIWSSPLYQPKRSAITVCSEVEEKRQLLNFVFQKLKLDGKKLLIQTCEPFTTLVDYKKRPKEWGKLDLNQRPAGYEGGKFTSLSNTIQPLSIREKKKDSVSDRRC
jgi:hypothetical protein